MSPCWRSQPPACRPAPFMMAMARAIMAIAMPGISIRPNAMTKTAIFIRIAKMPAMSPATAMAMATSSTITVMGLMAGMTASITPAIPFTSMIGSAIAIAGATATGAIGKIAARGAMPAVIVGVIADGPKGAKIGARQDGGTVAGQMGARNGAAIGMVQRPVIADLIRLS